MGRSFFLLSGLSIQMKGIFSNRSALFQLGILLYFAFIGLLLSPAIGHAVIYISGLLSGNRPAADSPDISFYALHTSQFFSGILIFILPAICTAYFCSKTPAEFLKIKRSVDIKILLLSAIMLLLISPAIDIATYLNSKIYLPEFMSPVADWMQKAEEHAANITEKVLSEKGFFPFVANIFIIGVMAGLTEEFFFRGALMSIIIKKIKKPHAAIWIVAIIFSIIHFQFSGFIPRILLGAYLGYLLYWTRNIWVPVFAHFLNNTIAITGYKMGLFQLSHESSALIKTDTDTNDIYITVIVAIVGLALFALCVRKLKKRCLPAENEYAPD